MVAIDRSYVENSEVCYYGGGGDGDGRGGGIFLLLAGKYDGCKTGT